MSGAIYDNIDTRQMSEEDRGERVERMVDIYVSADTIRAKKHNTEKEDSTAKSTADAGTAQEPSTQTEAISSQKDRTGGDGGEKRWYVLSAVICVLLSVLLLAALIVFSILYVNDKNDVHQLHETISQVRENITEKDVLLTNLTKERDQLQTRYNNLTRDKHELQMVFDKLKAEIGNCAENWKTFDNRLYFISNGLNSKRWRDGKQDCIDRGAKLVIVNSEEKQRFLVTQNLSDFWIGLKRTPNGNWKWVDDTPLNKPYWRQGEPNHAAADEDCVVFITRGTDLKTWNDDPCSKTKRWICEFEPL